MYWAGGCPSRVHRSNKPYPGATRFMQPTVTRSPRPPLDWYTIFSHIVGGAAFIVELAVLIWLLSLTLL